LAELKTLDARIQKKIANTATIGLVQNSKLPSGKSIADFKTEATANIQSIEDLIARKSNLKSAIVQANATTFIVVGGNSMTISDAITHKTVIALKKELLVRLNKELKMVIGELNTKNENVNTELQTLLTASLGKDTAKVDNKSIEAISVPFLAAKEWALLDPMELQKYILKLEAEISEFEIDIDATLSEANAITTIYLI
jgi:hypothetical protein